MAIIMPCSSAAVAEEKQPDGIVITDAWTRASLVGSSVNAVYLTISNQGKDVDAVTAVATSVADMAQLHSMEMQGDIMKMRHLEKLTVQVGQKVSLEPGGNHIMLVGLKKPLKSGQTFVMTLTFEHLGQKQVSVLVK